MIKSLKEKFLNSRIKAYEKRFLTKNEGVTYRFFGYVGYDIGDIPVFVKKKTVDAGGRLGFVEVSELVWVFTPKMLEHCVLNLTNEAKLNLKDDIGYFYDMCTEIANESKYNAEGWEDTINMLAKHIEGQEESERE